MSATIWLTGLPAAGKTTIAELVAERLSVRGVAARVLDGDVLRRGLCADLGFSKADREENVRRVAHLALELAGAGVVVVVAVVSPYAAGRAAARELHATAGVPFHEVFVDTPLAVCEARDPKGLYAKARAHEITDMTGVDDPYEPPEAPELTLTPAPPEEQARAVLSLLG